MAKMQVRTRRVPLDFLGEAWSDAYIDFRRGRWEDAEAIEEINTSEKGTKALIATLQLLFAAGKMVDESGQLVDMAKENIAEFDNDALIDLSDRITEGVDPKALTSSSDSSEGTEPSPSDSPGSNTENASGSPPNS